MDLNEMIRNREEKEDLEIKKQWQETLDDLREYFKDGFVCERCNREFYLNSLVEYKKHVYLSCDCKNKTIELVKYKNKWMFGW